MQVHDIFVDGKRLQDWVDLKRFDVLSSVIHVVAEAAVEAGSAKDGLLSKWNQFLKDHNVNQVKREIEEESSDS